ncbi:hypothetical protein PR202_gb04788 [Eleusine coracana subsp. coracana]|uniref:Nuclear pore complex protein Nup85 n=1 Tax=Eleusine coracana subsp. coracana TaxID=191504 RepID=A0AAV5E2X9_ELECO|nr:hypothetical protein PR202_gb04788 [Eleusine coracana subsp. coracana]
MPTDGGGAIVPFSGEPGQASPAPPPVRHIRHGVAPPISRVFISWSSGNLLQVACLRQPSPEGGGGAEEVGGRVVEVNLGAGGCGGVEVEEEFDAAEMRQIEYGSVPAFALLQSRKNALTEAAAMSHAPSLSEHAEWWQFVLEYSKTIGNLLGNPDSPPAFTLEDPKTILKVPRDKFLFLSLVIQDFDSLLSKESTVYSNLSSFQKKLIKLQIVEDDPDYWNGLAAALSVGWLDIVVNMLRFHGSYQLDQMDNREIENGLVEAVAVLVSTMPRMRPDLPSGKLGQCCKTRPDFIKGFEGMHHLAQKCIQLKPSSGTNGLTDLLVGILSENPEVVLAECTNNFGPWFVTHAMELLTADNDYADMMLHEERPNFGGISIEELHRIVYAQVLCSHSLTWQISGIYHWKHGRKGDGVYWFQQAHDKVRLDRIAQQLFERIGKSVTDDSFKQWEGLLELLGSDIGSAGGLEFLHRYRDFKRSLQQAQEGRTGEAAPQTAEFLIQLMRNPSTPQRFWLPLLHDSVELLNCKPKPLLNVAETTLLLNKLQELSLAKLHPDFSSNHLPSHALNTVRLALASNLARAILEE